ncbi:DNA adenine methylase [Candidatus Brevifilum fermentans]|jgi:DNA adenine methylase|uniref:site-specific DNA-methyltransferase (adenine-specific) n=1 Tax=Candidatus Brevifilum fermentans TaxID=1986204 RepID=A0A1Y6K4V8_9CHLR|nr:DNA adenine methylase [Brevefilum fermentans]SMX54715.1 Site-specific DNA methylase [Brevefilum fermentans]
MDIKSPLRYPGGKSRAIKKIIPLLPSFIEYREPFVGGGSIFISIKQKIKGNEYWINDLNIDLYLFWKYAKEKNADLVESVREKKKLYPNGKDLFSYYKENRENLSDFERAVRFFILNRITFSGTIDSGGYSEESFQKRFTESSIIRLKRIVEIIKDIKITNFDYESVVKTSGENVFIFLDPPYFSTKESKIYGKGGDLHANFDHFRFAKIMRECEHKWLITYDDCNEIRELFSFAHIIPWSLQYGMNNFGKASAKKGNELFICNYLNK